MAGGESEDAQAAGESIAEILILLRQIMMKRE
jgi:hypothetical protein